MFSTVVLYAKELSHQARNRWDRSSYVRWCIITEVTVQNGRIVLIPVITIEKDQAWFWTEGWQKGEREADEDIKAGRVKRFNNVNDLIADLESED